MKTKKILFNNFYIIKYIFQHSPLLLIGIILTSMLYSLINVISNIILLKYIIDVVSSGKNLNRILYAITIFVIYTLIVIIIHSIFNNLYLPVSKEKLLYKIQTDLYEKAMTIDLANYDNPKFYDNYIFSMTSAPNRINNMLNNIQSLSGYIINFIITTTVFTLIDKKLLILVAISMVITLFFNKPISNAAFNKENETIRFNRKKDYFRRIFYLSEYAKEIRLSSIGELILNHNKINNIELIDKVKKVNKKIWIYNFLQIYLSGYFMVSFVIVLYLGYKILIKQSMGGGDFIAIFNGVNTLLSAAYYILGDFVKNLREEGLFVEKFRTFMEITSDIKNGNIEINKNEIHTIIFENVSFKYNDNDNYILNNINLKIEPNKKIAIVGLNGAGKTTLIKLLLRLYDVSSGKILINNYNIKDITLNSYRDCFSSIFQDFQIYSTSIAENISMDINYNIDDINLCLKECNLEEKILQSKNGLNTSLLREFDEEGIILSGGEMQRLALARTLYNKTPFIILDEASASLDPIAEYNLNKTIVNIAKNKTVIFITHRLTTTVLADKIYVMNNGNIIEEGTHHELLKNNGLYSEMWAYQSKNYKGEYEELT